MKRLFILFFIPVFTHASPVNGGIVGADGKIHELLSVVTSVKVNKVIDSQNADGNEISPLAYPETIKGISLALTGMISMMDYYEFNGRSWANIFLRSHTLPVSYFDLPDVSFNGTGESCQGTLNWLTSGYPEFGIHEKNPMPELNGICKQRPFNASPGASFSSTTGNVYSLRYGDGFINGYTIDDVINYFNEVFRPAIYRQYESSYRDFMSKYPLCSSFSHDVSNEDEIKPSGVSPVYNVNGNAVSLMSFYKVKLISRTTDSCILNGRPVTTKGGSNPLVDSTAFVNAYSYQDGKIKRLSSIFSGGDTLLLNSYLSGVSRKFIPALAFSSILNVAWAEASAYPDYKGLPYSDSSKITESDVMSVMNNRNVKPVAADMFTQISDKGIYLMYWSDTHNSYVTEEVFESSKEVNVDFGPNPGIEEPELVQGALSDAFNPLFKVMPFLKNFRLDTHSVACPVWTYQVFGQAIPMTSFCVILEQNRDLISLFFIIQWTITSLIIIVRT
ncbi:hypothetical protein H8900_001356 [Salmonella enterica]|nr:hypothetical protein [Salmonella enterica]